MKGYRTYFAGFLAACFGFALLVIGHYHPPDIVDKWMSFGLIVAGFVTMGVRGLTGAKTGR